MGIERVESNLIPCDRCNRSADWWIPGKRNAWLCQEHLVAVIKEYDRRIRPKIAKYFEMEEYLEEVANEAAESINAFAEAFAKIPLDDRIAWMDED